MQFETPKDDRRYSVVLKVLNYKHI